MSTIKSSTTSTTAYQVVADTTGALVIQTGATPTTAVTIDTSQNVGVGTTSPVGPLTVRANSSARGIVTAANAANPNFVGIEFLQSDLSTLYGAVSMDQTNMRFFAGSTERARIDSNGQLGLGTASPDYSAGFVFATTNGASGSGLHAQFNGTTVSKIEGVTTGTNITAEGARNIQLYTNSTERARIDSSGNLGIGTSSPSTYAGASGQLVVYGGVSTTFTNNPANVTLVNNGALAAGLGTGINFTANYNGSAATTFAVISGIRENATANNSAGVLVFGVREAGGGVATERARLNSTGAFVLAGGTTTANGIGITFPATQSASTDANTLDDYEEGTWTPVFKGTTGDPTVTYTQQSGRYVKIGRMFYWGVAIRVNTTSGGSGILYIESPVPILSTASNTWGGTVTWNGTGTFTGQNPTTLAAINGSTALYLHTNSTLMATSDVTVSQLADGANIEAFGMFETG